MKSIVEFENLYIHRAPALTQRQLAGEKIHRADELEIYAFDREFLAGLVARLERRMAFDLSVTDRHLFLNIGGTTLSSEIERIRLEI